MSVGITKFQDINELGSGDWEQEENLKMVVDMPIYCKLIWRKNISSLTPNPIEQGNNSSLTPTYTLKGFVLIGDTSQGGVLTAFVKSGRSLSQAQRKLTMGKRGTLAVGMIK